MIGKYDPFLAFKKWHPVGALNTSQIHVTHGTEHPTVQLSCSQFGLLSQSPLPLRPLLPFSSPPPLSVSQTACAGFIRSVCQQMMMLGVHLLQCLENSAFKRFHSKVCPVPITKTERVNEWIINPLGVSSHFRPKNCMFGCTLRIVWNLVTFVAPMISKKKTGHD